MIVVYERATGDIVHIHEVLTERGGRHPAQRSIEASAVEYALEGPRGRQLTARALATLNLTEPFEPALPRLRARGAELVGEVAQYEDKYRLCYVRGPEGTIVGLAEQLRRTPHLLAGWLMKGWTKSRNSPIRPVPISDWTKVALPSRIMSLPGCCLSLATSSTTRAGCVLGRDYQHRERLVNEDHNTDTPAHFLRILSMAFPLASSSTSLSK
jgi:hypothetical protein